MALLPPIRLESIRPIICPMITNIRIGATHDIRKLRSGDALVGISLE